MKKIVSRLLLLISCLTILVALKTDVRAAEIIASDEGTIKKFTTEEGHKTDYIENATEWTVAADGNTYWYEDGYRQGYDSENPAYRGKEIFDSKTNAWYWLDNVQNGAVAKAKDVYQESTAGVWAAGEDGTGKWVRYDADGLMIKGWCAGSGEEAKVIENFANASNDTAVYYFDKTFGTMAKGYATIDGKEYYFDESTGVMDKNYKPVEVKENGWVIVDGKQLWYEGFNRQGYNASNAAYRGKEIFDPETNAWYWLDNVQGGAKAVSKDVYQESLAGEWGATVNENGEKVGKWVRYDANGLMLKGWCAGSGATARVIEGPSAANGEDVYYFDTTYGTMAKGNVVIDGKAYKFNEATGVLDSKVENQQNNESQQSNDNRKFVWIPKRQEYYSQELEVFTYCDFENKFENGVIISNVKTEEVDETSILLYDLNGNLISEYSTFGDDIIWSDYYSYDDKNNRVQRLTMDYRNDVLTSLKGISFLYDYSDANRIKVTSYDITYKNEIIPETPLEVIDSKFSSAWYVTSEKISNGEKMIAHKYRDKNMTQFVSREESVRVYEGDIATETVTIYNEDSVLTVKLVNIYEKVYIE